MMRRERRRARGDAKRHAITATSPMRSERELGNINLKSPRSCDWNYSVNGRMLEELCESSVTTRKPKRTRTERYKERELATNAPGRTSHHGTADSHVEAGVVANREARHVRVLRRRAKTMKSQYITSRANTT